MIGDILQKTMQKQIWKQENSMRLDSEEIQNKFLLNLVFFWKNVFIWIKIYYLINIMGLLVRNKYFFKLPVLTSNINTAYKNRSSSWSSIIFHGLKGTWNQKVWKPLPYSNLNNVKKVKLTNDCYKHKYSQAKEIQFLCYVMTAPKREVWQSKRRKD